MAALLAGCGGGGGGGADGSASSTAGGPASVPDVAAQPTSLADASRLADQASFGATEAMLQAIMADGPARWVAQQMRADVSRYTRGGSDAIHRYTGRDYCADNNLGASCWADNYSHEPLASDFFRNAVSRPDQLRQRVALALQQILVVSSLEVEGTYGLRHYQNLFLAHAFGNWRTVLEKVALSPLMGDYLNNLNNDRTDPNENFARELLQLFSLGTCELEADGNLRGGACQPTYDNAQVRAYAYALTGWTYPAGGASPWCQGTGGPDGNCRYYQGDMVPRPGAHDDQPRALLSGVTLPAGRGAPAALQGVLDSLMAHPNIGPFIGRQLIQHLVTSNPSPAYVRRVATAFDTGRHAPFGSGTKGDLQATVAAVLLDPEARGDSAGAQAGRLREPVQYFAGVLRALGGQTDGRVLTWSWGADLGQHVFRPSSVFNFYPPDYPVAGTALQGPQFGILNAGSGLARINYLNFLLYWGGAAPSAGMADALGTRVDLQAFEADAADPARLVDRMLRLAVGGRMSPAGRQAIIDAVAAWDSRAGAPAYLHERIKTAAYLVFASPHYQVTR
ncbi:DUF1800 domain-containing protein [Ramlibacter tataouinensis]|uniref:DUF1800 domain-containing protein n=1 Tax=Ramlibacter tataouinensis TaxID=94132 RepID=UPI001D0416E3|nr:DUF1800 domain-containing protein [Ramlibacter tataouinensis]